MEGAPFSLKGDQPPAAEHSRAIDCPVSVLQNLRASVLGRFNSTPHGGGDVTGVLFGTRDGDAVRISAFCASTSEGDLQHSEALTETQRAITAVIAASRDQKELAGLEPVGWFRGHPRCQLILDERDLEMANALFPQPWQVALVMRPGNSASTRVCFYFRDREGPWTADCAVREFTVPPADQEPAPEATADPAEAKNRGPVHTEPYPYTTSLLEPPETRRPSRLPVVLVIVCAMAALAGGVYYWFMRPQTLGLSVHLTDSASQLRIAWDRTAGPISNAKAGYVEIGDGGQTERVDLDAEQLQFGYVNHQRQSNHVTVRLVVMADGGVPVEEDTQFVAPVGLPSQPPAEAASDQASSESAESVPEKTPELVVPVPVETGEPAEEPAKSRPAAKFQPPVVKPAVPLDQPPAPEVAAPTQAAHSAPATVVTPPVVHTEPPTEKPAPQAQRPAPVSSTAPAPSQAQSVARVPVTPHVPAAPSSGRVIWIGRLQKNQPVTINGRNSSTGTLIGEFPGRPFKFSLSPGDLSSDGIVLYSANMQYANSVVEPPGALNGWNKTVYTWNPKFANDVSIDEGPAAQNGWNRMVLRSKNPKISVIVIDWTAVN
jgi:proteasome lid subunit RPN8/RPN11